MALIKRKSKKKEKGNWFKTLFILITAIFACTAPFIHIFYPKVDTEFAFEQANLLDMFETNAISKEQYEICLIEAENSAKVFGFTNIRKFWYAAGKNICLLFSSFILMYISFFITDIYVKKIATACSFMFMGISGYFVIWVFWWDSDFPSIVYHICIVLLSVVLTLISYILLKHFNTLYKYIRNTYKLTDFILDDIDVKYIDKNKSKDYTIDIVNVLDSLEK